MTDGGWLNRILAGTNDIPTDTLTLDRCPRAEEIPAAVGALRALDSIQAEQKFENDKTRELDARKLFDRRLLAHKEVLRRHPPIRVRCRCGRTLDWIAIAPLSDHGLQLVHGPGLARQGKRLGGAYSIVAGTKTGPNGRGSAIGTVTWAQDSDAGVGNSRTLPNGAHGDVYALKAHYRCPQCPYEETILHVSLLREFLTAVERGDTEVRLGPIPGAEQPSKPRATPIADRGGARAWSTRAARAKG
jgi:hypothetical protein